MNNGTLLTLENSELLARTGEEVDKIRKQLDASRDVSDIFTVLERLKFSFQDWVETQRQQLEDIRKSLQSNENTFLSTSNS